MSADSETTNWGILGIMTAGGGIGGNVAGSIYLFRNNDTKDVFLFALLDIGAGASISPPSFSKLAKLAKLVLSNVSISDPRSYTSITANRKFAASDLHLARGAEGTASLPMYNWAAISAWPMFNGAPKAGEVNNDYFSGVDVSGWQIQAGAGVAFRMFGTWLKLWSF